MSSRLEFQDKVKRLMPRLFKRKGRQSRIFYGWRHKGWGDSIFWTDWEGRELAGHLTPVPEVGDILKWKMESGKIASFRFVEVRRVSDPRDQFFAKVSDLGYD